MNSYTVYSIISPNGLTYIGITKNYKSRMQGHKNPNSGCTQFIKDKKEFGWDAFTCKKLHENLSQEEALSIERELITALNTLIPNGYNKPDKNEAKKLALETGSLPYKDAKPTQNRKVILKCLSESNSDCGGQPPYSASSVHYMLELNYEWYGAKKPVSISQINRTLRDLMAAGLIVKESRIDTPVFNGGLPCRVNYYQLTDQVERNLLLKEINDVLRLAEKVHGSFFFGHDHFFDKPVDPAPVIASIKALMQKTHPDKVTGFEFEFNQLNRALEYCRADIDLLKTPHKKLKLIG